MNSQYGINDNADSKEIVNEIIGTRKISSKVFFIATIGIVFIALSIISIYLYNQINILKNSVNLLQSKINSITTQVDSINSTDYSNDIQTLEKSIEELKTEDEKLKDEALGETMEDLLTGRVVTDDFVIERANCEVVSKANALLIFIDLGTQPTFSSHYMGQGRFNIPDRELKSSLQSLISEIQSTLEGVCKNSNIDFNEAFISISIKNYDIATSIKNELELKGE